MKNKLLAILLSVSIILLTISSFPHQKDTETNSFSTRFAASTSLAKYNLQIHVPAPSSDDYEEGT